MRRGRPRATKKKEYVLVYTTDNAYSPEQLTELRERINQELTKSEIVQVLRVRTTERVELLPL